MRLWSLNPSYLDSAGLVALWREALLAQKVLEGNTKGYRHHPQLVRFRESGKPMQMIGCYLSWVHNESLARGYSFDLGKINSRSCLSERMPVTRGQLEYEAEHLKRKLQKRAPERVAYLDAANQILPHPLFDVVEGGIAEWEVR